MYEMKRKSAPTVVRPLLYIYYMNPELVVSSAYRTSRRILQAISIFSILWSIAQLEFKSISFDAIAFVDLNIFSIPISLFFVTIFFSYHSVFDYLQQPILIRRSKHARVDFQITFYLMLISVLALSISIESRSVLSLLALLSLSIPFLFATTVIGIAVGFAYLFIRLKLFPRKGKGIAAYVMSIFSMSKFIMKCVFVIILIIIGLLYSFTSIFNDLNFKPSILGVWSTIVGFSFVMATYTIRHGLFQRIFCYRIYDNNTETLHYFDKYGKPTMSISNVKENGEWTGKLPDNATETSEN